MGKEGERRGEVTEEQEAPSPVWAGLRIQQSNASVKPFASAQKMTEVWSPLEDSKVFVVDAQCLRVLGL